MDNVGVLVAAFCVLFANVTAHADPINKIRNQGTNNATMLADAMKELRSKYGYTNDMINKAYEACQDMNGEQFVPCVINSIHVEKLLVDHKYSICVYEYLAGTLVECSTECFARYNIQCLKCVGNLMPTLVDCVRKRPSKYAKSKKQE